MKIAFRIWLVGSLIFCALGLFHLHRETRASLGLGISIEKQKQETLSQETVLKDQIAAMEREKRQIEENTTGLLKKIEDAKAVPQEERTPGFNDWITLQPDYVSHYYREQRRKMQKRFGPLFEMLSLSPEKLEEFKKLLVERQIIKSDVGGLLWSDSAMKMPRDQRDQYWEMQFTENDKKILELLGAEKNRAFEEFRSTAATKPAEERFEKFQLTLLGNGLPGLQPEQFQALNEAYRVVNSKNLEPFDTSSSLSAEENKRVCEMLVGRLSSVQLQELAAYHERVLRHKAFIDKGTVERRRAVGLPEKK